MICSWQSLQVILTAHTDCYNVVLYGRLFLPWSAAGSTVCCCHSNYWLLLCFSLLSSAGLWQSFLPPVSVSRFLLHGFIGLLDNPLQTYGHSKLFKMAAGRHLGFGPTGSSAVRSADPKNPTLEAYMRWIRWAIAEIWHHNVIRFSNSFTLVSGRQLMVSHVHTLIPIELLEKSFLLHGRESCSKFDEDWFVNDVTLLSTDAGWMERQMDGHPKPDTGHAKVIL